jgi:hypothetical protein
MLAVQNIHFLSTRRKLQAKNLSAKCKSLKIPKSQASFPQRPVKCTLGKKCPGCTGTLFALHNTLCWDALSRQRAGAEESDVLSICEWMWWWSRLRPCILRFACNTRAAQQTDRSFAAAANCRAVTAALRRHIHATSDSKWWWSFFARRTMGAYATCVTRVIRRMPIQIKNRVLLVVWQGRLLFLFL